MTEMTRFLVGDEVNKTKGYEFVGTVVSVFTTLQGNTRLVVESKVIPGMLHIFSPEQMYIIKRNPAFGSVTFHSASVQ